MVNEETVPGSRRVLGNGRDLAVLEDKADVVGAVLLQGDIPLERSAVKILEQVIQTLGKERSQDVIFAMCISRHKQIKINTHVAHVVLV